MYKPNPYSEYFEIDEAYYPEINPDSIKNAPTDWKKTYPHGDFVSMLETVEKMLARGRNTDKKSLWIEGSYGTGKSRLLWTLRELLTCSESEFRAYFAEFGNLRTKTALRDKLLGEKSGKIVTAVKYGTGGLTSTTKLIREVFDALTNALRTAGCRYSGAKTLRGRIAAWLEADDANMQLFNAKIRKPQYGELSSFQNKSAEKILMRLKDPSVEVSELVDDILILGEKEGIVAFNISMEDLKSWIAEVIADNGLKAIVFLWDEFSSFFKTNRNNLDEFQKLAELSADQPFYLVIATHMSALSGGETDQSFRIVRDRFLHKEIRMPDNIAFELIAQALKINDAGKAEWTELVDDLQSRVNSAARAVAEFIRVPPELMNRILPIHPMAALMLKYISSAFASNQRSMFNFIKTKNAEEHAFQYFIANNCPRNGDLLTIDYLWDFFYEVGHDETTEDVGRNNLDSMIRMILDSYHASSVRLNDEERVVLKTVLMMQAISYKTGDGIELMLPTEQNLQRAFAGIDNFESGRAVNLAKLLVDKGILFKKPGKYPTYAAAAMSGDQVAIDAIKKQIRENTRTNALVEAGELMSAFELTLGRKLRYKLVPATADDFTITVNKLTNEAEDYKIRAVVCFARNDEERMRLQSSIKKALTEPRYDSLVLIDATACVLGADIFEKWIDTSAAGDYWREKDKAMSNDMQNKAQEYLRAWRREISEGKVEVYSPISDKTPVRRGVTCPKLGMLYGELDRITLERYPYSFDNAKVSEGFFQAGQLQSGAENGIWQKPGGVFQERSLRILLGDVWQQSGAYWKHFSDLPISELKIKLDALISTAIERDRRISFDTIFAKLQDAGFLPCNLYAYLMGFLMKEYAHDPYRYSIGADSYDGGRMTAEKLKECIADCIKHTSTPNRRERYLEIMTRNQQEFMRFAHEVFQVDDNVSVEKAIEKICSRAKTWSCPLWSFREIADESLEPFLSDLEQVTNPNENASVPELTDRMGEFLLAEPHAMSDLKDTLSIRNVTNALRAFLERFEGGVIFELSEQIDTPDVFADVKKQICSGEAAWLWKRDICEEEIGKLLVDYKIIRASRALGRECNTWNSMLRTWIDKARFIKAPCKYMIDAYPALKTFFEILRELATNGAIAHNRREDFLRVLTDRGADINAALDDAPNVLREKCSVKFAGFSDEDFNEVYADLPTNSFSTDISAFLNKLDAIVADARLKKGRFKLESLWRDKTDTNSPREWSKKNLTPILIMVPDSERDNARELFDALNFNRADTSAIENATKYLETEPQWLNALSDKNEIDAAFRRILLRQFGVLFKDLSEIRAALRKEFIDPDSWFQNDIVRNYIEQLAEHMYLQKYSARVADKIKALPEETAKQYLIRLVKDNYKIGIEILSEGADK